MTLKTQRRKIGADLKKFSTGLGKTTARVVHTVNRDIIQPVGRPVADVASLINPSVGVPLRAGVMAIDAADRAISAGRTIGARSQTRKRAPAVKFAGDVANTKPVVAYALHD